ncbi:hypothetical protein F5X96DRAFT_616347 [Biscogniauxia mediterranea]|nr:hypothetical protein F5X96DRAFT_616347 [Biscogniauxia mediterranea]
MDRGSTHGVSSFWHLRGLVLLIPEWALGPTIMLNYGSPISAQGSLLTGVPNTKLSWVASSCGILTLSTLTFFLIRAVLCFVFVLAIVCESFDLLVLPSERTNERTIKTTFLLVVRE